MIEYQHGNLIEADADALVNTVNCAGVMGKGIALQFKQAYPANFRFYEKACRKGEVQLGKMLVFEMDSMINPKYIVNFPTKQHWRGRSRLKDIQSGLRALVDEVQRREITSIAVPPLGCGNGGLDWNEVRPLIEAEFSRLPHVRVLLFAPQDTPAASLMPVGTEKPRMTRTRALFIKLLEQYGHPGYQLSLLEVQKLAYFLQAAGEPLQLKFVKHKFGPYADNLNHVLQRIEGHFIRGYGDRQVKSQIQLIPDAPEAAKVFLSDDAEAQNRLERVARLIEGFENPYGMELLATILWVIQEEKVPSTDFEQVIAAIHAWSDRKRTTFRTDHIQIAWQHLREQGWLTE